MLALHLEKFVENDLLKMQSLIQALEAFNATTLLAFAEAAGNNVHLPPTANTNTANEGVAHHLAYTAPIEQ